MNKAQKKFLISAVAAVFVLLTVLLAVINVTNFTMISEDADRITEMIANRSGSFGTAPGGQSQTAPGSSTAPNGGFDPMRNGGRFGPMGLDSPELNATVRYFTIALDDSGKAVETVAFRISAVTEEEAKEWAASLVSETTGWTHGTYRYRVTEANGLTYVTVVDQARELLPSYRILIISAVGDVLAVVISYFVLKGVGTRLFAPLEEADRSQKKFIANADKEFRLPLTIISANTELLEKTHGPDDQTRSIRRQVGRMNTLVEKLRSMSLYPEEEAKPADVSLSDILRSALDGAAERFAAKGLSVETAIADDVTVHADPAAMTRMADELIDNALRYATTDVTFRLRREGDRILLETENGAALPDGPCDQIFDRFTTLGNAPEGATGLGLAYVKDIVRASDGRLTASVTDGTFSLRIAL